MVGGYCFLNEQFDSQEVLEEPRLVDQGQVTEDIFLNPEARILEMNSKSGLYPLYMAYSLYAMKLPGPEDKLPLAQTQALWQETVEQQIFVLCKTRMAESITRRTLVGYQDWTVNTTYIPHLLERMENDPQRLAKKLQRTDTWGKEGQPMKFDAIVGIILTPILMSILSSENAQRFNQSKTYFTLDLLIGWHSTLLRVSRP